MFDYEVLDFILCDSIRVFELCYSLAYFKLISIFKKCRNFNVENFSKFKES